ncbi:hypothetical protein JW613_31245 [Streptomyces smyrnaeus]|uniref:Uncharacterized protein n=1 Tax=Streptomyces smyrnaeus TaxID=1387713 RepID=A0ABS3Y5F5_9ACTN|nr:hypothetical protein [Streptomyces smyrnaeus]MBO8202718.1 hypothetical protein [Streptomyces smyrnaeus]
MTVEADTRQERVVGRVWAVRLDPYGRPYAGTVRLSCSRPACPDQRFGSAAAGRKAAVDHINMHLARIRESGGPRGGAWCACRATNCAWHAPGPAAGERGGMRRAAQTERCGGSVVLTVHADRAGRLWRIAEMCARCAAATTDCRVLDTAPPPARTAPAQAPQAPDHPAARREPTGGTGKNDVVAVFSHHSPSPAAGPPSPAAGTAPLPRARASSSAGTSRRAKRWGKIAQRTVPRDLQPDDLRAELIELGDAFRAYQKCPEPDLALLARLHERKAAAFQRWADVSGDGSLLREARRAEKAARTTLWIHENRSGRPSSDTAGGSVPQVEWLLTRQQAGHARTVLDYVTARAPHPEAGAHLAVLMLTLRAARAGAGNVTGQDLTGWLRDDAEQVLERLATDGWLRLPGTVGEALASRPENPTTVTVPSLLPDRPRPFTFGKTTRSRISGWAQKAAGDRKIRKKKLSTATRLLALYTAAHARPDGHLGHAGHGGLRLDQAAAFCALPPKAITEHAELLTAAEWLTEADTSQGTLRGRLAERVLPLGGRL